jgi:hypothetical protein
MRGALGALLTAGGLLAAGELFLRCFPPRDFVPYLGTAADLAGPYRPDGDFGVGYRCWDAFRSEYGERLARYEPLDRDPAGRPTWAMFGSSFVQAPGMLGDTAQAALPDKRIFFLGRNEPPHVRMAQVRLLLEHGLRPERIFLVFLPHDLLPFARHSLDQIRVTPAGGIAYSPRLPAGAAGDLVGCTRLGLLAWVRAGRPEAVPGFRPSTLLDGIPPAMLADLRRLFDALAEVCRRHHVPVSVVLIPNYEQISSGAPHGFQETMTPLCLERGLDVCDLREVFARQRDKPGLFLPDNHFTPRGNRVLLDGLLAHLRATDGGSTGVARGGVGP